MSSPEPKIRVAAMLSQTERDALHDLALKRGLSMSALLRMIVRDVTGLGPRDGYSPSNAPTCSSAGS
jgi:hypothetical protein